MKKTLVALSVAISVFSANVHASLGDARMKLTYQQVQDLLDGGLIQRANIFDLTDEDYEALTDESSEAEPNDLIPDAAGLEHMPPVVIGCTLAVGCAVSGSEAVRTIKLLLDLKDKTK